MHRLQELEHTMKNFAEAGVAVWHLNRVRFLSSFQAVADHYGTNGRFEFKDFDKPWNVTTRWAQPSSRNRTRYLKN